MDVLCGSRSWPCCHPLRAMLLFPFREQSTTTYRNQQPQRAAGGFSGFVFSLLFPRVFLVFDSFFWFVCFFDKRKTKYFMGIFIFYFAYYYHLYWGIQQTPPIPLPHKHTQTETHTHLALVHSESILVMVSNNGIRTTPAWWWRCGSGWFYLFTVEGPNVFT